MPRPMCIHWLAQVTEALPRGVFVPMAEAGLEILWEAAAVEELRPEYRWLAWAMEAFSRGFFALMAEAG